MTEMTHKEALDVLHDRLERMIFSGMDDAYPNERVVLSIIINAAEAQAAEIERLRKGYLKAVEKVRDYGDDLTSRDLAIRKLRDALNALVTDVLEYENVNSIAPNQGKDYCWQSIENAARLLAETEKQHD